MTIEPLHVLVFGHNYAPEGTGIGRYTTDMAEWLARRGHSVTVITAPPHYPSWRVAPEYRGRAFHRELRQGVTVLRTPIALPGGPNGGFRTRVAMETSFNLAAARWWLPRLFDRRIDVVLAICPPIQGALWPWLKRVSTSTPWVFHIQDLQLDAAVELDLLPGPAWMQRLMFRTESGLLSRASRVSTITEGMRQRLLAKGIPESATWLLPNWADPASFDVPEASGTSIRRRLGVGTQDVLVLYAGNMGAKQGLQLVLDAADRLRDETTIHFAMVGDGVTRRELERRAAEMGLPRIRFSGPVDRDDFGGLLAAADVHLVVQRREASDLVMPSKTTNILAAGRPMVATADPDTELHRVVSEVGTGLVVPPGDADALANAIRSLAGNPGRRRSMGVAARSYAKSALEMNTIMESFEERLGRLVERAAAGRG